MRKENTGEQNGLIHELSLPIDRLAFQEPKSSQRKLKALLPQVDFSLSKGFNQL